MEAEIPRGIKPVVSRTAGNYDEGNQDDEQGFRFVARHGTPYMIESENLVLVKSRKTGRPRKLASKATRK